MLIYKIFRPAEWQDLIAQGQTKGAPIDLSDGYIHFSTGEQAQETAAKHFAGAGDLVLAAVEAEALDALKLEPSRGGALFPHLYRPLTLADVVWHKDLPEGPSGHIFPKDLT